MRSSSGVQGNRARGTHWRRGACAGRVRNLRPRRSRRARRRFAAAEGSGNLARARRGADVAPSPAGRPTAQRHRGIVRREAGTLRVSARLDPRRGVRRTGPPRRGSAAPRRGTEPDPRAEPPPRHAGRAGGPGGRGDRHGPGGDPPAQPDPGRRLSLHLARRHALRGAVAPQVPRAAAGDDGLREAARGAGGAAQARRPSRHRARLLHRAGQPFALHVRHRRRAHLGDGRRDGAARPGWLGRDRLGRDGAGAGDGGDAGADRRHRRRRAGGTRARASPPATPRSRPMAAAPGPAAAPGSAARRCFRRGWR